MSWMAKLYETYEAGADLKTHDAKGLMPISHTLQNAHINIVIDGDGNFLRASVLEKTQVILPATEKSAGRSSGEAPHPLADKIQYVAKDYPTYGGRKKSYFSSYKQQLESWCQSEHGHEKAIAVYRYISKGAVVHDLISAKILYVDETNKLRAYWPFEVDKDNPAPLIFKVLPPLDKKKRIEKDKPEKEPGDAMVCWSVELPGIPHSSTWDDKELQQSWIDFDASNAGEPDFCYVTGKERFIATNHPAKLRHTGDKAKLVSANDSSGFTFRGRFTDKNGIQVAGVGFEVTQKAHNALRWLISRQGYRNGDQVFVAWAVSGKSIPPPFEDPWAILSMSVSVTENKTSSHESDDAVDHTIDLGQSFAEKFNAYLRGYGNRLEPNEQIVVIGLDSATPGRMGIIYYRELLASEFLDRLESWHQQFAWPQRHTIEMSGGKKGKKKTIWPKSAPAPRLIADAAYGNILKSDNKDKLRKNLLERVMPCIVDNRPMPKDIVMSAVKRASNRNSGEPWEWERNLGVTCALYKGFYQRQPDNKRRDYAMTLEKGRTTRDYLYGRLLAIAERTEEMAMIVTDEKPRSTVASRLMQRFADRPFSTWLNIEKGIVPYQERLKSNIAPLADAYKRLLDDVCDKFDIDEFKSKEPLSGEFLLGFHSQRKWLRDHKLEKGEWVKKEQ